MDLCDQSVNSEDEAVAGPSGCSHTEHRVVEPTEASCSKPRQKRWKYETAYFNFLADFRADHKGKNWAPKEVARKAGEAWRRLSNEQKKPYEEAALRNRKSGKGGKRAGNKRDCRPSMGRKKMSSRGGKKPARRVNRRRDDTDYETDDDGSSVSYDNERSAKRRKTTATKGKGKRRQEDEFDDSDVSCICGMKHHTKTVATTSGKKGKRGVRKRAIEGGYEESDAASGYSSVSDD